MHQDADEWNKRKKFNEDQMIKSLPFKPEIGEINKVLGSREESSTQFVEWLTYEKFEWQKQINLAKSMLEISSSEKSMKLTWPVHSQLYLDSKIWQRKQEEL